MKRERDKVLFDSPEQKETFERALLANKGADCIMIELMLAIGRSRAEGAAAWRRVREELGDSLAEGEELKYDWISRELKVSKMDSEK